MHLFDGIGLGPAEMRHVPRCDAKRPQLHQRERRPIEVPSHTQCPCALYDGEVFVDGMSVRKDDISHVLMDSQDERLSGFREIPPNLFHPLALLEFVQGYNGVMD